MSEHKLPDGWRWVRLGDVCEFLDHRRIPVNQTEREKRISGKNLLELYPYYGANGQVGWIDDYIFDEPLILLAEDGGFFGSRDKPIAYAISGKFWVNNHAHVLKPRENFIDFAYCLYSLSIRPDVGDLVAGATRDKLNQTVAQTIPIPLPPLSEQRRIAAILTEQMAVIEQARAAAEAELASAEALTAAYLRDVFESENLQQWKPVPLGDVLIRSTEIVHPYDKPSGPAVFVGLEHIESGTGIRLGEVPLEMSELTGRKPTFYKGQIVYGYLRPYLNKVWIAEFDGLCSVDQYVYSVVPSLADTEFVAWYMRSPVYMERSPLGSNTSQLPRIRADEVASVEVNLPPLDEQRKIVTQISEYLAETYDLCVSLKEGLEAINQLPAALLRRAFNGEL
jgi:type I restriction enzyme S subunit